MGEGWADFVALLLFVEGGGPQRCPPTRTSTAPTPSRRTRSAARTYAPDVLNNAYYYGIRRYPYSRDMSKNPLTFKHIADGVPAAGDAAASRRAAAAPRTRRSHNTGEVWATMLWECYRNLLNDTGAAHLRAGAGAHEALPRRELQDDADRPDVRPGARRAARRHAGAGRAATPSSASPASPSAGSASAPSRPNSLSDGQRRRGRELPHDGRRRGQGAGDRVLPRRASTTTSSRTSPTRSRSSTTARSSAGRAPASRSTSTPTCPAAARRVCRFFSTAFGAKSSHFYTPDRQRVRDGQGRTRTGSSRRKCSRCRRPTPPGDVRRRASPVYRLYNNGQGGAPNHRYTTSLATRTTMLGKGWISEGKRQLRRNHVQPSVTNTRARNDRRGRIQHVARP